MRSASASSGSSRRFLWTRSVLVRARRRSSLGGNRHSNASGGNSSSSSSIHPPLLYGATSVLAETAKRESNSPKKFAEGVQANPMGERLAGTSAPSAGDQGVGTLILRKGGCRVLPAAPRAPRFR